MNTEKNAAGGRDHPRSLMAMKNDRRLRNAAALLLAGAMLISLFACGSREGDSDASTGGQTTGAPPESSGATSAEASQEAASTEEAVPVPPDTGSVTYDTSEGHPAAVLKDGDALVGGTYTATGKDESVLEASGNTKASVTGSKLVKASGDASSADDSSFMGVNAGVRVYGNAEVTMKDCTVLADAKNATGVFAYENGVIYISDSTVRVTGGGAGGVQVAGGGTLYGNNLTVTTESKAPIRSDRGGGTMVIDGGSYVTNGKDGCPVIYSTADITVRNAEGRSNNSRAVIIEGKNSVTLENSTLTGNDQSSKAGSVRANVMIYQSASGDAKEGTGSFTMTGGKLVSESGAMFYCTNTTGVIDLKNAELVLSGTGELLIVSTGRWGKEGKNGGRCTLNAEDQTLSGTVTVDALSTLDLNLKGSRFTGSISGEGSISLIVDPASTWTLTGDSYITSFSGDASNIIAGGYTLYVGGSALTGTR